MSSPSDDSILHITPASGSLTVLLRGRLALINARGVTQWALSTNEGRTDEPAPTLDPIGVEYIESQALTRSFDLRADARFFVEVFRLVRRLRPDVTMTYGPKPGAIARVAARLAGSRVVHTHWGNVYDETTRMVVQRIYKAVDRIASLFSSDVFVTNSADLERFVGGWSPGTNFHYLGNATDIDDEFNPATVDADAVRRLRNQVGSDDEVVVTLVGRVVIDKGYREFVQAASEIVSERPDLNVRFVFVGRRDTARGLDFELAKADHLIEQGFLTDLGLVDHTLMPAIYAASDIVCLPSYREGFPRSLVEAASMGRPAVATDIAGCREAVNHGETGLLVPARDAEALRDGIERLAADQALRRSYGDAARVRAEKNFSEKALVDKVLAVVLPSV